MTPVVRYMLICDDVHPDAMNPLCIHVDCLMSKIVSLEEQHFPLLSRNEARVMLWQILRKHCVRLATGQLGLRRPEQRLRLW